MNAKVSYLDTKIENISKENASLISTNNEFKRRFAIIEPELKEEKNKNLELEYKLCSIIFHYFYYLEIYQ